MEHSPVYSKLVPRVLTTILELRITVGKEGTPNNSNLKKTRRMQLWSFGLASFFHHHHHHHHRRYENSTLLVDVLFSTALKLEELSQKAAS
jgi:hypothetical protein